MSNFLLMILQFSQWFATQVLYHYLVMRTYPKYCNGGTSGKCCLILMFQARPRDCFLTQKNPIHNYIYFSNMPLNRKNTQKHLGLYLDAKPNFSEHINEKIKKAVKEDISVIN